MLEHFAVAAVAATMPALTAMSPMLVWPAHFVARKLAVAIGIAACEPRLGGGEHLGAADRAATVGIDLRHRALDAGLRVGRGGRLGGESGTAEQGAGQPACDKERGKVRDRKSVV